MEYSKEDIMGWLNGVMDPEIPVLSLIDLGVIRKIDIVQEKVIVHMTPTFVGCPAMDYMKAEVEEVLLEHGVKEFEVDISFETQWSSNMISEKGKIALKKFGLAPPPKHNLIIDIDILENVPCPFCDSTNTELKSPFGPTLCRSLHYCNNCYQGFEQFKPL